MHTSWGAQARWIILKLSRPGPCLTKPRTVHWNKPNKWQMKSKPRERDKKIQDNKMKPAYAQTHTFSNKGKTLESKTQSICCVQGEWSHMFLISPLAEQGEVMMKSSLSSGQVQIHWAVCILNGFRNTNTHICLLFFVCNVLRSAKIFKFPVGIKTRKWLKELWHMCTIFFYTPVTKGAHL